MHKIVDVHIRARDAASLGSVVIRSNGTVIARTETSHPCAYALRILQRMVEDEWNEETAALETIEAGSQESVA